MKRMALAAIAAVSLVTPATAAFTTIERARVVCASERDCGHWIAGTVDAYLDAQAALTAEMGTQFKGFCLPQGADIGVLVDLFREHLESPVSGSREAAPELFTLLREQYPC